MKAIVILRNGERAELEFEADVVARGCLVAHRYAGPPRRVFLHPPGPNITDLEVKVERVLCFHDGFEGDVPVFREPPEPPPP